MEEIHISKPSHYEIKIEGQVDPFRFSEFEDMDLILLPNAQTLISGRVVDQAALFGILIRIRDMGIPLISVNRRKRWKVESHFFKERK